MISGHDWRSIGKFFSSIGQVALMVSLQTELIKEAVDFEWRALVLPHRVEDATVLVQSQQLIGHGNRVYVRVLAIVEVGVGPPDLVQHLNAQRQTLDGALKAQPLVAPILPEIAIH